MALLIMLAAAALAQANPSQTSQGSGPTVVVTAPKVGSHPDAKVEIDDEDISDVYGPIWPTRAFDRALPGKVILSCRINARGFAQSCTVASESPPNQGFGDAALQLQPSLRLPPPPELGGAGSVVKSVAINFTPPQDTQGWGGPDSIIGNSGRGLSRRTGRPMVMEPVTMMDHPVWTSAPSFDDMRLAYPAKGGGGEGFVVLRCQVERGGDLARCTVSKELPDYHDFGPAAMSLSRLFHVSPDVMAKAPGHTPVQVMIPIRFAPPQAAAEQAVTAPTWISGFDPNAAPKLFPAEAAAKGVTTGRGVARCRIGADGMLTECTPEKADPDGLGFSEAAVVLAQTMKVSLWSADAGPVRGGVIVVPIRLNLAASR